MNFSGSPLDAQALESARQQAEICKVFGNVNRILILWVLDDQEMSVGDIAEAIDASVQNASQHLRMMKDKGILACRREGHAVYYRVEGHELIAGCWVLQRASQDVPLQGQNTLARRAEEHDK